MSEFDLSVIAGFVLGSMGCVSVFAALVEGNFPRGGLLYVALSIGAFALADSLKPTGLEITDIPEAFIRLVAVMTR
ncbi:MAG: hypothetical protein AAFR93_16435 [Pseudomonadota bacterium]